MKKTAVIVILILAGFMVQHYLYEPAPEIRNASPSSGNIICFGDSLTYGTGASPGMDYPSRLSELVGEPVLNAGVPGDTTGRALMRLKKDVLNKDPRIVLITLGGNDLKNGVPKDQAFNNLKQITLAIQAKGALVVLGGIDFPLMGRGYGDAYLEFAKENGVVLIPDIFAGLFGDRTLMSDSIHPNDAGYAVLARKFYDALKPYVH